jgi:MoxR-like ATPase
MASEPLVAQGSKEQVALLRSNIERVIRGKSEVVELAVAAMLAQGHILLEDVPGVGKTTLGQSLAQSIAANFQRIQFTSDLLPADILGVTIFNQERQEFEFIAGPIFTNVLLADEINRATPKTQSALLEAMNEGTVTIERRRLPLPSPFLVIATQNPVEHIGTYPLPESQLDRFLLKLTLGYPNAAEERQLIHSGGAQEALGKLDSVLALEQLQQLQEQVSRIHLSEAILDYLMAIVHATRDSGDTALGVSTRGMLAFSRACQALALVRGRDFVIPEDVKQLSVPVLSHRIVLADRRSSRGDFAPEARVIERIVASVAVPR